MTYLSLSARGEETLILAFAQTGKLKRQGQDKKRSKNPQGHLSWRRFFGTDWSWIGFSFYSSKHFLSFLIRVLSFSMTIEVKVGVNCFNNLTSNNEGAIHRHHLQNLHFTFSIVLIIKIMLQKEKWSFWALTLRSWMSNKSSFTRFLIIKRKFCKGRVEAKYNFVGFHLRFPRFLKFLEGRGREYLISNILWYLSWDAKSAL